MSRINGEKARAAIAKRNRTALREKTRAIVASLKSAASGSEAASKTAAKPAARKKS